MELNIGGDYWFFKGNLNPMIVRLLKTEAIEGIKQSAEVVSRKGERFTTIQAYLYRNHEINETVEQHASDLLTWSSDNTINQHNGLSHKPDQVFFHK